MFFFVSRQGPVSPIGVLFFFWQAAAVCAVFFFLLPPLQLLTATRRWACQAAKKGVQPFSEIL
jgi:hypothetical protein